VVTGIKISHFAALLAITTVLQLVVLQGINYLKSEYIDRGRISTVRSDYLVNTELSSLLQDLGNASRVRVELIQSAIHTPGRALPLYRFSTRFIKSVPGVEPGPYVVDLPLSEWNDFLPDLIDKQCITQRTTQTLPSAGKERFDAMNVGTFIACPMIDSRGFLVGALFVNWSKGQEPGKRAIGQVRDAAGHITDYLERRVADSLIDQATLESDR
jgi:hypothetical protein